MTMPTLDSAIGCFTAKYCIVCGVDLTEPIQHQPTCPYREMPAVEAVNELPEGWASSRREFFLAGFGDEHPYPRRYLFSFDACKVKFTRTDGPGWVEHLGAKCRQCGLELADTNIAVLKEHARLHLTVNLAVEEIVRRLSDNLK